MGKPINIFEQRKYETNVIDIFNIKNDTGWWDRGRRGGDTVTQKNPCMVIRAQPKYRQ